MRDSFWKKVDRIMEQKRNDNINALRLPAELINPGGEKAMSKTEEKKTLREEMHVIESGGTGQCDRCYGREQPMVSIPFVDDADVSDEVRAVYICSRCLQEGLYKLMTVEDDIEGGLLFLDVSVLRGFIREARRGLRRMHAVCTAASLKKMSDEQRKELDEQINYWESQIEDTMDWDRKTLQWFSKVNLDNGEKLILVPISIRENQGDGEG